MLKSSFFHKINLRNIQLTDLNAEGFLYESSVSLLAQQQIKMANEQLTVIWTSNLDGELGTSIPTENEYGFPLPRNT